MTSHLHREMEKLKRMLLLLTADVTESLHKAVKAVTESDSALGRSVCEYDERIDSMEVEIEEECLKILALHQPVAIDLRFIVTVLKMNRDLERIGDFAVSIASKADRLSPYERRKEFLNLPAMAEKAQRMLKEAVDALVEMDTARALNVLGKDDELDVMKRAASKAIRERLSVHPEEAEYLLDLLSIARHMERIGDHVTNIAEDLIYMIEGKIVRHHTTELISGA
jgi:phosphate transport system protein